MSCNKYKLTYFDIAGRAELSRLMFALKGQAFEDERIKSEKWPEFKKQTPFGWMPILTVNKKQYCDSMGIAKYLAREFGFGGKNNVEMLEIDQVIGIVVDLVTDIMKFYFEKDEAKKTQLKKAAYAQDGSVHKFMRPLENIIKENKPGTYFVGKSLTVADVAVMDALEAFVDGDMLNNYEHYPLVKKNINMVLANSKIQAFKSKK